LWNAVALAVMVVVAFPVYWMFVTSFRDNSDIRSAPRFLPVGTLDNYRSVFERDNFWSSFGNSIQVTLLTVVFALFTAFLAAVAVSRFRFRGRVGFLVIILLVQMVPAEALMISVVKTLDGWNLRNSIAGLTITYVAFVLPFTVWTLRGFVGGVPRELEEAAMVDGSSRLRAFFSITLPLVAPGLVATGIFAFILGGICLYGSNARADVATLTSVLHDVRPSLVVALDEEGGDVTRLEAATGSSVPGNAALGAVDDVDLTRSVAAALGQMLCSVGIDLDLAPCADVNSNPANPVIGVRSFGADPALAARHTAAAAVDAGELAAERVAVDTALSAARHRPLVVVVRDPARRPAQAAALGTLLAARPDAVVVDMGWPSDPPADSSGDVGSGAARIITYGASRASGRAVARRLLGVPASVPAPSPTTSGRIARG
jgi:N,N'-diacetylchitobiose transport system permease protein